jgi:hypothetical protein
MPTLKILTPYPPGSTTCDSLDPEGTGQIQTPVSQVANMTFGNSLRTHTNAGGEGNATSYTAADEWIGYLASLSNKQYSAKHKFGFLENFDILDMSSMVKNSVFNNQNDFINNSFDFWPGYFSDPSQLPADSIDNLTFVLSNFIGTNNHVGGDPNFAEMGAYDFALPTTRAVINLTTLINRALAQRSDTTKAFDVIIYCPWADANPYNTNDDLPTPAQFNEYKSSAVTTAWLQWHIDLANALAAVSFDAELNVRMIPVGPIIFDVIDTFFPQYAFEELFYDISPHGREIIYLIAGMICYRVAFKENPNLENWTLPAGASNTAVMQTFTDNREAIKDLIQLQLHNFQYRELNNFNVYAEI